MARRGVQHETGYAPRQRDMERTIPISRQAPAAAAAGELDRLIHERIRLGMLSALAVNRTLTFSELPRR